MSADQMYPPGLGSTRKMLNVFLKHHQPKQAGADAQGGDEGLGHVILSS